MSDSVGSVSVDVVPDARGWAEKLRAQIRDVTVKVELDTTEANTKLDALIAKEDEAARTRHGKVDVDTSGVDRSSKTLGGFLGNLGLIPTLAIPATAALIPLVGVLGGIAVALAAPLAIAGGGATLFAFLGAFAVKDTEAKLKNIDKLRQHLGTLTKGTAEYAAAQKQLRDAQAALTPEQVKFAAAQDKLTGAFQKFLAGKGGQTVLDVMAQGMGLLAHLLPIVAPVMTSVGGALSSLLTDVDHATQGRGFERIVDQFARLSGRDIRIGGHILGELAKGVGALLLATDKGFSGSFLHGLDHLSTSFADWANSKSARHDMREFFGYLHDVGPQVGHTLGAIAHAAGQLIKALAPLGPPVLKAIEFAANAISAIPVPVLTGLAAAFTAAVLAAKAGKGINALTTGLAGLGIGGKGGTLGGILTGGVQKVYVVNMGPGGLGGGAAGEGKGFLGGLFSKALPGALGAAGVTAGTAAAWTAAGAAIGVLAAKGNQLTASTHRVIPIANHYFYTGQPDKTLSPQAVENMIMSRRNDIPEIRSTSTHIDALRANLARASRQIDMIGPHANAAFGAASKDVDTFAGKLAAIHDKKIAVTLQAQAAVRSLEALQAYRLRDKNFNVYAHYQQIERIVGPGGGQGQNPHGSGPGSGSGGGAGRTPVHIHLDESGRTTLSGFMSGHAQGVYDENQRFQRDHG